MLDHSAQPQEEATAQTAVPAQDTSTSLPEKVRALLADATYEKPTIKSFAVDGLRAPPELAFTGNL